MLIGILDGIDDLDDELTIYAFDSLIGAKPR